MDYKEVDLLTEIANAYYEHELTQEEIAKKLKKSINSNKEELKDCVEFANGLVKLNPWTNIERFNTYYVNRYGFNIL